MEESSECEMKSKHPSKCPGGTSRPTIILLMMLSMVPEFMIKLSGQDQKPLDSSDPLITYLEERNNLDKTVWNRERLAQYFESRFTDLWDRLRKAENKLSILQRFPLQEFTYPATSQTTSLENGIVQRTGDIGRSESFDKIRFRKEIQNWIRNGYSLIQSEWHHQKFQFDSGGSAESIVSFDLHLKNDRFQKRVEVRGTLRVKWQIEPKPGDSKLPVPESISVIEYKLLERSGNGQFVPVLKLDAREISSIYRLQPMVVEDLDGDKFPDIILGGVNRVLRNRGDGSFQQEEFLKYPTGEIGEFALVADFTGDGHPDFFCVTEKDRLPVLYPGNANGEFLHERRIIGIEKLNNPSAITAGDIDGDGDLDVWLTQYKGAYTRGQMPTPYYDANDGYPSYLLLNDGTGQFSEVTGERGLSDKRLRRTYSSSFVDMDGDLDLDLVVVSDFSGLDVYRNDGNGFFSDVRDAWIDEWHNFGMSHCFGDFNGDGRMDLYVVGMSSTTMRRLDSMGLVRAGFEDHAAMRSVMGYGNRMYIRDADRIHFTEPGYRLDVARTGWSWGSTAFDFDNDADLDIYVANGHISGESTSDYCSTFWCHDIYTGTSKENPTIARLLNISQNPLITAEMSWNGYEKNKLLMNHGGEAFTNASWVFGSALQEDCRGVVSADLNRDGRLDLLVIEEWWKGQRRKGQILHILANKIENDHHWVGLDLPPSWKKCPLPGTRIRLVSKNGSQTRVLVNGDSFASQHPRQTHFGLGQNPTITKIEIMKPDGSTITIPSPPHDQYIQVTEIE